jgi:two-component system chemotaxis response regulator CheY
VLVVDDSPHIRDLIRSILVQNNYEVEIADNGAQALDKYVKFKPDVVTLDLSMPVIDGYETLCKIFQLDQNALIIMLTAIEDEGIVLKCLEKGARGYLTKPFRKEELLDSIGKAFSLDHDKHIDKFFSQVRDRLDGAVKKLLHPSASVNLKEVKVISKPESPQSLSNIPDLSQIKAAPKIEPLKIEKPQGAVGYVTEIGGMQEGVIISFIREEDLDTLIENVKGENSNESHTDLEIFNIIHMKILSELSNSMNLRLNSKPIRLYDEVMDRKVDVNEVSKVKFEIILENRKIPIEVQLWVNIGKAFSDRIKSVTLR